VKNYIVITSEGTSIAPNNSMSNCKHVIGFVKNVENQDEALKKLIIENSWIFDSEYNVADFEIIEILF
jgi:hypothetical protein